MLNVTRYGYEQLIADGVLDRPIVAPGRHPYHTMSQLQRARQRLFERAAATTALSEGASVRPLSDKMLTAARSARGRKGSIESHAGGRDR